MRQLQPVRTFISKFSVLTWLLIIGLVWLVAAVMLWWHIVYTDPKNVFEGMLKNNLTTVGFTKETTTDQGGLTANELAQLQLGKDTTMRTLTTLKQQGDTVVTDAISTQEKEYVRYVTIDTESKDTEGNALDFSKAKDVWASGDSRGTSQAVTQAVLGVFPMGNVPAEARNEILADMKKDTVFSVKYDKVKKETIDGRQMYTYEVQLLPQPYIAMLKKYGKAVGLGGQVSNLNPSDYADAAPTDLKVSVDVAARRLVSVSYIGNDDRKETFSAYGIIKNVDLPKDTISMNKLQELLSNQ